MPQQTTTNHSATRAQRKAQMLRQKDLGHLFSMPATNLYLDHKVKARVRPFDLQNDLATLHALPDHLRQMITDGRQAVHREADALQRKGLANADITETIMANMAVFPAAEAYCIATFISPRLALTEDEAVRLEQDTEYWEEHQVDPDDREVWTIDMIEREDQVNWFMANYDADKKEAMKLQPFRPRSVIDVAHRPAEPVREPATFSVAPASGDGAEQRSVS